MKELSMMKAVVLTWRNKNTLNEYSGGSTRLHFLLNIIRNALNISDMLIYTVDELDTVSSKAYAFIARVLSHLSITLASSLREYRFNAVNCKKLVNIINKNEKDDLILILDHIRSVIMIANCINDLLKYKDHIIHISHDFSTEHPYRSYFTTGLNKKSLKILEKLNPITITVSMRDKILYEESANLNDVIVFPNIYPPIDDKMNIINYAISKNEDSLIINIVKPVMSVNYIKILNKLIKTLEKYLDYKIKIRIISSNISYFEKDLSNKYNDRKISIEVSNNIPSRIDYLKYLSEGHIGIVELYGKYSSGTNVRRYDYALAAVMPALYYINVQGERMPHEIVFRDIEDLVAKLTYLSINELIRYGISNKEYAIDLFNRYFNILLDKLHKIL